MSIPQIIQIIAGVSYLEPDSIVPCCSSTAEQQIGKFCKDENSSKGLDNMGLEASKDDLTAGGIDEAPEVFKEEERVPSLQTEFVSVLKSYKVWLLMINAFLWNANVAGFFVLINDYIVNRIGINEDEAALGITILGAANLLGCLAVIGTSSLNFDRLILHIASAMLFSICTLMIAFTNGKVMYYALTAGWGLGQGVLIGNLLATVTTFGTDNQFFVLFGLQLLAEGIGALGIAPITGYIASKTTDQYGIIFTGCCGVLSAISLLPVLISNFRTRRKAEVANWDRESITASRKTGII